MTFENTLYHAETGSLECIPCMDVVELSQRTLRNPELLMEVREEYEMDHSRCHKYKDVAKAGQAREFRTESQRRKLHETPALRVIGAH